MGSLSAVSQAGRSVSELRGRYDRLKTQRYTYERVWQDIIDVMAPFNADMTTRRSPGDQRVRSVFDTTGMLSSMLFSNIMKSAIMPSTSMWLRLEIDEPELEGDPEVQDSLDSASLKVLRELGRTNFYTTASTYLRDFSLLGNGVMYVEENTPTRRRDGSTFGGWTFQTVPLSQVWWDVGRNGQVILLARRWMIPALDAFKFFEGRPGRQCERYMSEGKLFEDCEYVQFCYPNENRVPGGVRGPVKKAWVSDWLAMSEGENGERVRVSGFDRMPFIVGRCYVTEGESYGRGHGHLARPDVMGINELRRQIYIAAGKDLLPPLVVENDSMLQLNANPDGVIVMREPNMRPDYLRSGTRYDVADVVARQDREQVEKSFLVDQLRDSATQPRSAEESRLRQLRAMQALSAPADAIRDEFVSPLVATLVSQMHGAGALPELDDVARVAGGEFSYKVHPVSPLFTAQKSAALDKVLAFVERLAQVSQVSQDPTFLDYVDPDEVGRLTSELADVPSRVLRTREDVLSLREARAQQAAMAQMQEMQMTQQGGGAGA